jgi:nicotinamidase/pyrazinamidase
MTEQKNNHQQNKYALLCVDVQNDFCPPNGALAVPGGTKIIPIINQLRAHYQFDKIVLTLDNHTDDHISFIDTHSHNKNLNTFDTIQLDDGTEQTLWPPHCVINTVGAQLHPDLHIEQDDIQICKGMDPKYEFYSAFWSSNNQACTQLAAILKQAQITHVVVVGLAYEYCVGNTALDARKEGFQTIVLEDAVQGLNETNMNKMKQRMLDAGVQLCNSEQLSNVAPDLLPSVCNSTCSSKTSCNSTSSNSSHCSSSCPTLSVSSPSPACCSSASISQ